MARSPLTGSDSGESSAAPPDKRWRALVLIALAQVGAMSTWFSATAVGPALRTEWSFTQAEIGLLSIAVQLGFVTGGLAAAITGVADVLSTRAVFVAASLAAAAANAAFVIVGGELGLAIALRFALGFTLAGVYPTGMKIMTGWFRSGRGFAIGVLVGALTLGAAAPHLIAALGGAVGEGWRAVILATSAGAVTSALIMGLGVRKGPFEGRSARLDLGWALGSLRDPALRLANFGYFGHMWELYAMWTWLPAFLVASFAAAGVTSSAMASLAAGSVIAAGGIGSIVAGVAADRIGRTTVTAAAMTVSGTSAIVSGLLFGAPVGLVVAVTLIWGISIVADSAQFSAAVTELAPPDRVGSALALQTAVGFALTAVSIQVLPAISGSLGWAAAFAVLSLGPIFGVTSMLRLRRRPEALLLAGGNR